MLTFENGVLRYFRSKYLGNIFEDIGRLNYNFNKYVDI